MTTSEIAPAAYQLVPLSKLSSNGLSGLLIADGVGLGKTISASLLGVYFSQLHGLPTAIVCSPILVTKWLTELRSKFGLSAFAVRSKEDLVTATNEMRLRPLNFYVVTSSLLSSGLGEDGLSLGVLIIDEIQNFRNHETRGYAAALALAKRSKLRVGLSATPINNSLDDLSSELALLLAEDNWEAVSAMVTDLWSWDRERITRPLVTRFVKERLGIHFARRQVRMKSVRFSADYNRVVDSVLRKRNGEANIYEIVTYLRMAASCPELFLKKFGKSKLSKSPDPKLKFVRSELLASSVTHWLLFVEFEGTARYLAANIREKPVFVITGRTPIFERDEIIASFEQSKSGLMILTPVGGEGLDLQFCQGVINYDLHWNPMKIEQRIGRIDRIGQTKDAIEVINIRVADSVDDHVLRVIFKKLGLTEKSIFATGDIVFPKREARIQLRQRAFEAELNESKQLLSAIRYNDQIGLEEYSLLGEIDDSYCNPAKLRESALTAPSKLPWLSSGPAVRGWRRGIEEEAIKLREALSSYS